jgi:hypothetical protein
MGVDIKQAESLPSSAIGSIFGSVLGPMLENIM